ncbi:MAG: histidine-type phosphatase [Ruminococcaceae bacterium]|nr:histidine-type phosphatase [Oscillospiraceae bacterium]
MSPIKRIVLLTLTLALLLGTAGCGAQQPATRPPADPAAALRDAGYTLEQVVVLSRHNIRSPLSGPDSLLGRVTTHEWTRWSSDVSELTVRGGVAENAMGQYFRQWAEENGLFEKNARPAPDEVRFYANAKQRTLATARNFAAGMFPVAEMRVETHADYDTMDPVFNPVLTFCSPDYDAAVQREIDARFRADASMMDELKTGYALIEKVLDYRASPAFRAGDCAELLPEDFDVVLEQGQEPAMRGSLKLGCQISDALVLQSYEAPDAKAAGFGRELTAAQWAQITAVKDYYVDILFTAPLVSVNVAHPLLDELQKDLDSGRKFTFLCGHDSNIASVLAALDAAPRDLPGTPEAIPIGSKLTLEVWSRGAERFLAARMVYAGADMLRDMAVLTPDAPPLKYTLAFTGLQANADGLYTLADFQGRLQQALDAYDALAETYGGDLAAAA